jgi:hypothetical protein
MVTSIPHQIGGTVTVLGAPIDQICTGPARG